MSRPALLLFFIAATAFAASKLPPAKDTEQWLPVPPVVSAPANGAPSDAIVLFDGKNFDAWEPVNANSPGWALADDAMVVVPDTGNLRTRAAFGDVQLHLEFRTPSPAKGTGQLRGNSGVFFMGLYELQVLDSFHNETYVNGMAGSIYKQHPPLANVSRPPGEWQTYDVVFIAPRFDAGGKVLSPARMTVFYNGVLVQYDAALRGGTVNRGRPKYTPHAPKLPLVLQNHGFRVAFRNIWVRELN